MARAKSTRRAEARRRYRAAQAAARGAEEDQELDETADSQPTADAPRSRIPFRLPDIRSDVVALPGILLGRPLILAPIGLMLIAFALTFAPIPADPTIQFVVQFYVSSFLYPGILAMFLGGVLAPRATYLVGLLIGIVNGLLVVARTAFTPSTVASQPPAALASGALQVIALLALYGLAIGAFAGWYRDFLRRSAQRRRATMDARARERKRDQRRATRTAR